MRSAGQWAPATEAGFETGLATGNDHTSRTIYRVQGRGPRPREATPGLHGATLLRAPAPNHAPAATSSPGQLLVCRGNQGLAHLPRAQRN